ncbi:hypothetical protein BJX99DRAFT_139369 [Aspergillus californicus]
MQHSSWNWILILAPALFCLNRILLPIVDTVLDERSIANLSPFGRGLCLIDSLDSGLRRAAGVKLAHALPVIWDRQGVCLTFPCLLLLFINILSKSPLHAVQRYTTQKTALISHPDNHWKVVKQPEVSGNPCKPPRSVTSLHMHDQTRMTNLVSMLIAG